MYGRPFEHPAPRRNHSKAGAIIPEPDANGLYHMVFGESLMYHATSSDLLKWTPDSPSDYFAAPLFTWEMHLIEPGPAPVKTRDGKWLFLYNGAADGRAGYKYNQYSTGQMLIDLKAGKGKEAGCRLLARLEKPILIPDQPNETDGQVNQVVFTEGLVQFKGKWYLYYGESASLCTV